MLIALCSKAFSMFSGMIPAMSTSARSPLNLSRIIAMLVLSSLLTGCALNYSKKMSGVVNAYHNGQTDAALAEYDDIHQGKDEQDLDMLYYAERGEILRARPDLDASTREWLQADGRVTLWEDSVRTALTRSLDNLDEVLFNKAFSDYQGQDYEKVQLSTRLAENHLLQGQWEQGRVAIRRMYEREAIIKELREHEVEALRHKAQQEGIDYDRLSLDQIENYPVQIFNDPQVIQLRNAYQSAASHYLAGFVFESLQEKGLAAAGYRNAIELRPDVPMLRQALAGLDHTPPALRKKRAKPAASPQGSADGQTDVLFIIETGAIPPRQTLKTLTRIPLLNALSNVIVAYPVLRPADVGNIPAQLTVDNKPFPVAMVTSLDAMARRALKDEMPAISLRNAISAGVQAAAHVGAGVAMETRDDDWTVVFAAIGQLTTLVAANYYAEANSDTRQWQTLPAYISLVRARLPAGEHQIALSTPNGGYSQRIYVDGRYALVVLHQSGNSLSVLSSSRQPDAENIVVLPQPETRPPVPIAVNTASVPDVTPPVQPDTAQIPQGEAIQLSKQAIFE